VDQAGSSGERNVMMSYICIIPQNKYNFLQEEKNMKKEIAILAADNALANVGVTESDKDNHGRAIAVYLRTVNLSEGFAWCAAFLKYRYMDAANDLNEELSDSFLKLSGYTPDWKNYAQTHNIWIPVENAKKNPELIKKGYAALFYSEQKGRIYHIGIVISSNKDGFITVEGNTSPGPGVQADGDGVYKKKRTWKMLGTEGGFMKMY